MAEETEAVLIEDLQKQAKAAVLRAITDAAPKANQRGLEGVESIARAFAAVAGSGPAKGEAKNAN